MHAKHFTNSPFPVRLLFGCGRRLIWLVPVCDSAAAAATTTAANTWVFTYISCSDICICDLRARTFAMTTTTPRMGILFDRFRSDRGFSFCVLPLWVSFATLTGHRHANMPTTNDIIRAECKRTVWLHFVHNVDSNLSSVVFHSHTQHTKRETFAYQTKRHRHADRKDSFMLNDVKERTPNDLIL